MTWLPHSSKHAISLKVDFKQPCSSVQLDCKKADTPEVTSKFSHMLSPSFALSCWNNRVFGVDKSMLLTSKQTSNGKEDFMCIKHPVLRLHSRSPTPVLKYQWCQFFRMRHPWSAWAGQEGVLQHDREALQGPLPISRLDTSHKHFSEEAGLRIHLKE